jgi:hypothetical protein
MGAGDLKGANDEVADYRFGTRQGVYALSVTVRLQGVAARVIRKTGNNCDRFCPCLINQDFSRTQQAVRIANGAPTRPRCGGSQFHV